MAKTILKRTPIHCVMVISGSGAETIDLDVDLLYNANETPGTCVVNIAGMHWSIPSGASASVVRNSVTLWELTGAEHFEFNGYTDNRENVSDIVVTIPGSGGSVLIELNKVSGYGNEQQRKNAGGDLLL